MYVLDRARWLRFVRSTGRLVLVLLIALGATFFVSSHPAASVSRSATYRTYSVSIYVEPDGSLSITEVYKVAFVGFPGFTYGYAEIPTKHTLGIVDIEVAEEIEGGIQPYKEVPWAEFSRYSPGTFAIDPRKDSQWVKYAFSPVSNAERAFKLSYRAIGGLQIYPDASPPYERIEWIAIDPAVTGVSPIEKAIVSVLLPSAVPVDQVVRHGDSSRATSGSGDPIRMWTWTINNMRSGSDFVVQMQFPRVTSASVPAWQIAWEHDRAVTERRANFATLASVAVSLLVLSLGSVLLYGTYRKQGVDPAVEPVVEYISEPPDDLPPALTGVLIDERADMRDITAAIIDLAKRGFLAIDQYGKKSFALVVRQTPPNPRAYEKVLLGAIFPTGCRPKSSAVLSNRAKEFNNVRGEIKREMYRDLVRGGYFEQSPGHVRSGWSIASVLLLAVAIAAIVTAAKIDFLHMAGLVIAGLFVVCSPGVYVTGRAMPRRTLKGAEARAKWLVFAHHLKDLKIANDITSQERNSDLFERYFPYAVAFGIQKSWVLKFAESHARSPSWFIPLDISGSGDWSPGHLSGGGGPPSLAEASRASLLGLSNVSKDLSSFFDEASNGFSTGTGDGYSGGSGWGSVLGDIAGGGAHGFG